jgi:predicted dienelactone hydrolase
LAASAISIRTLDAQTSHGEKATLGGRSVVIWRPASAPGTKAPLVIFSHGFGGCATQSTFLTAALASRGYLVVAPQHKDARCGGVQQSGRTARSRPEEPFQNPEAWSDQTFVDRADDIRAILDAIAHDNDLAARVDMSRLALTGHSLGGYTVVGLAGAWASWKLPNVKAVLALSPYIQPFVRHHTLSQLSAPVMYQGGTLDFGITPFVERAGGAYDASPAPKYFVDFTGAGHLAWTDIRASVHDRIEEYAIAFLDHYVRGVAASPTLTSSGTGVFVVRYDSELGSGTKQSPPRR